MNAVLGPARVLRPLSTADLDAVLAVENEAYAVPWTRGNFVDSLAAGYWAERLLAADGGLLGYYVAMTAVDELHLLNLTVAPAQQRRGHAQALLERLLARARDAGLGSLWLEVRASNTRARRLYLWCGLREVGLRRAYYPTADGGREDAILMTRAIDAGSADAVD